VDTVISEVLEARILFSPAVARSATAEDLGTLLFSMT